MSQHFSTLTLRELLFFSYGNHHNHLNENILIKKKKKKRAIGLNLCQLSFFYDQIKNNKSWLLDGAQLSAHSSAGHTETPGRARRDTSLGKDKIELNLRSL